jgi:hypothetical protein
LVLLQEYITMHGPLNVKLSKNIYPLLPCLVSLLHAL